MADDLKDTLQELERIDGALAKIRSDEILVDRVTRLADLLRQRVAAGDFNCICTGASKEQTLSR